ncbi:hypothetical protein Pogu_1264 [Pyrobaculum oguniense TE7]|uniref:Uncharacterized protein n=1 Tax=Pyrobaculum oguniense (strain DSM 13380 / JCM 10595 / TE7) TaxID=698757 RepID=H6QA90_PYROT|nr:hypothetical protein Pogu_1264 [Pyrobaculum oguniense TE7]
MINRIHVVCTVMAVGAEPKPPIPGDYIVGAGSTGPTPPATPKLFTLREEICNAAASVEGSKPNPAVVVDRVVF